MQLWWMQSVFGRPNSRYGLYREEMTVPDGRYHRQELLFGREGQAKLEACKVGIVGLGGLGSHVAQQLAYLGVLSYVLADKDRVSESNLNRLVGACDEDANICRLKVDVADELIRTVLPTA